MATQDDLRRIALSLPATTEKPSYGTPGFRVKDKGFARLREDGETVVVFVSSLEEKDALLAAEPKKLTTTPHYDGYPTVLVVLSEVDEDDLRDYLTESWRLRAPARLRAQFDEQ